MVLLQGPRGRRFLMSEVPLYMASVFIIVKVSSLPVDRTCNYTVCVGDSERKFRFHRARV